MDVQLDDGEGSSLQSLPFQQLRSMYPADKFSLYSSDTEERVSVILLLRDRSHLPPQQGVVLYY